MKLSHLVRRAVALIPVFALALASPPLRAEELPPAVAADVSDSFHLLSTKSYKHVDPQTLADAARQGIVDEARKSGSKLDVPVLPASGDEAATVQHINNAVLAAAQAAHGSPTEYAYAAIDAMARSVDDKYTQFFTPEELKAFDDALDPERISGIGVIIAQDAQTQEIEASYVLPGAPADNAGIHVGDVFTSIDGTPTKGLAVEAVSKMLRGKAGSTVHLDMARPGGTNRTLALVRSEVQPPTVLFKMLPQDIGYINVAAFGRATPDQFDVALSRLKQQGAKALVIDLRNDGGGYVDSALNITSRFVANRPLVTVEERDSKVTTIEADNDPTTTLPMTILVNQFTASASEITAGALQDDGIGVLIGTKTYGKGVMQTLTPLPDGAAIKITTAHYLTPNNHDINLRGIDPDVRVDENRDARFGEIDKDAQLRAAIAVLEKKIGNP